MKRSGKLKFFIVFALIIILAALNIFGISTQWGDVTTVYTKGLQDINWGLDIGGGTQAVFTATSSEDITDSQMSKTETIMKERFASLDITDYDINTDYENHQIIVRFSETDSSDAQTIISTLSTAGELQFVNGTDTDSTTGLPTGDVILTSDDVKSAKVQSGYASSSNSTVYYYVSVKLTDEGTQKLSDATTDLDDSNKMTISVWYDSENIYSPEVSEQITNGNIYVYASTTEATANLLADQINSGTMPVSLSSTSSNISPTLDINARRIIAIATAGILLIIAVFLIIKYRLAGAVTCVALLGHITFSLIIITGFFSPFPNYTLTLSGLAGIAVSLVMGLAYNITAIRNINEELENGRTLTGAVMTGQKRSFSSVLHSNILLILIAIVLVGVFGNGLFSGIFSPVLFMFDTLTVGAIHSFGYTLGIGIICNIIAICASRLMLSGLSTFDCFQNTKLYGGTK